MRGSLGWIKTAGGCRIVWAVIGSPQCWSAGSVESSSLQKQGKQGGSARAWPVAAPMPKLDSFLREKRGCLDWRSDLRTFFTVGVAMYL